MNFFSTAEFLEQDDIEELDMAYLHLPNDVLDLPDEMLVIVEKKMEQLKKIPFQMNEISNMFFDIAKTSEVLEAISKQCSDNDLRILRDALRTLIKFMEIPIKAGKYYVSKKFDGTCSNTPPENSGLSLTTWIAMQKVHSDELGCIRWPGFYDIPDE